MKRLLLICALFSAVIFKVDGLAQVKEEWVQRFTSDSIRDESVNDMFVDAEGNVYVTGSQRSNPGKANEIEAVTVKYNSHGEQVWIQNYRAPDNNGAFGRAIHVDAEGNVYVTGENAIFSGGGNQTLILKYSPGGTQLWFYKFNYTGNSYTGGFDIITDLTGNVYVAGEFATNVITYNNIFLIKLSPEGHLINQTFYHSGSEGGRKIALDGAGKIIIGGYANFQNGENFIALKYEQNLDFVWAQTWTPDGDPTAKVLHDMVIDINSNIILAGQSNHDYATVKIDPAGATIWGKLYNSQQGWDNCRAVVTDNLGNIYVTGETGVAGLPPTFDFTTIKYDPNGNEVWVRNYDAFSNGTDGYRAYDIAIDNSANIYITGAKYSNADIATIKYNSAGSLQWGKSYNGPSNSQDIAVAVGVDSDGNTYSVGNSLDTATGYDIAIIKYTPEEVFTSIFKKNNVGKDIADNQAIHDTIIVDYTPSNDYFLAGISVTIDSMIHSRTSDLIFVLTHNGIADTIIYKAGGAGQNFIGTKLSDSASISVTTGTAPFTGVFFPYKSFANFINANVNGNWILSIYDSSPGNTGRLNAWSIDFNITTIPTSVETSDGQLPEKFFLAQNYPNPFNPSTNLVFRVTEYGPAVLKIYDILGKEITTLLNEEIAPGEYNISFDASGLSSGVYFYMLTAGNLSATKKMILLR